MTTAAAQPLAPEAVTQILADFHRDGYALIRNVLTEDEVAELREAVERAFADPAYEETVNRYGDIVMVRLFEVDRVFRDTLVREPIIGLAEAILGETCHIVANNCVMNGRGRAIDSFHADELVIFPLPDDVPRHDPRIEMPVHIMTVQMPLTDVDSIEHGPTQFVPGSHYSGRQPNHIHEPTFEGRGPVDVFCKAGDIYLHNGQCWHRGAPNTSDRTRILLQQTYSRRWVSQRFFPFVNYQFPEGVLDGADERLRRVLGFHGKGPYG